MERSKVVLDPLTALLSAPDPPSPPPPPPPQQEQQQQSDDAAGRGEATADAVADGGASLRRPPELEYPPSATQRGAGFEQQQQLPLPSLQPSPPRKPSGGQPSPVPRTPNPFLSSSALRGPGANSASWSNSSNGAGGGGGGGGSEAMRQVGDVLTNLSSFLSSGLDSLSVSLSGSNHNSMASGGGGGGNGLSPPPPLSPHAFHPLASPSATPPAPPAPASSLRPTSISGASSSSGAAAAAVSEGNGCKMEDSAAVVPLLTGEQRLASLPNFLLQTVHGLAPIPGQLLITTYQVAFFPSHPLPPQLAHLPPSFFRVPMAAIDRTERIEVRHPGQGGGGGGERGGVGGPPSVALSLHTKDGRALRLLPLAHDASASSSSSLSSSPTAPPPPPPPSPSPHQSQQQQQQQQQQQEVGLERVKGLIDAYTFSNDKPHHLFCFAHHRALLAAGSPLAAPAPHPMPLLSAGATADAVAAQGQGGGGGGPDAALLHAEYARQFRRKEGGGVWLASDACPWRLSHLNAAHRLCASYPPLLVVPRAASDEELVASASFRSEHRLPALTWGSHTSAASIWRSSQPRVGMSGASCPEDERVLRLIGAGLMGVNGGGAAPPPPQQQQGRGILRIMDLRNKTAAMANRATGHGYESAANYPTCTLTFCGIGNIHAMREAATRLTQLAQSLGTHDAEWGALVEGTKWLTHLRLLLNAAYRAAHAVLREGASVLLHCSHGWDRTSQVASLAQLMLDPFYRTFDGFAVLVAKDWLLFGHPFHLRTAHGLDRGARIEEQLAPIFLQFLDAVYQLWRQHPALFEFGGAYLLLLADHLHDCRFGDFLGNTPKERAQPPLRTPAGSAATASIWTYLAHPSVRRRLRNPLYAPGSAHAQAHRLLDTALPSLLRRVALWDDYWLRWPAKPSHPPEAYAAMRRARAAAEKGGNNKAETDADVAVPWAWLEEEAERALWGGGGAGVAAAARGAREEGAEEDLIDLASTADGGRAGVMVKASAGPVPVASETRPALVAPGQKGATEEGEENAEGFVNLAEGAGAEAEEGAGAIATDVM